MNNRKSCEPDPCKFTAKESIFELKNSHLKQLSDYAKEVEYLYWIYEDLLVKLIGIEKTHTEYTHDGTRITHIDNSAKHLEFNITKLFPFAIEHCKKNNNDTLFDIIQYLKSQFESIDPPISFPELSEYECKVYQNVVSYMNAMR